jgi:hypothetical protein
MMKSQFSFSLFLPQLLKLIAFSMCISLASSALAQQRLEPEGVRVSPTVSNDGNFTVTWNRIRSIPSEIIGEYRFDYNCFWVEIEVIKDQVLHDYIQTNNCDVTRHRFTDYESGNYQIIVSLYYEQFEENINDDLDYFSSELLSEAAPISVRVNNANTGGSASTPDYTVYVNLNQQPDFAITASTRLRTGDMAFEWDGRNQAYRPSTVQNTAGWQAVADTSVNVQLSDVNIDGTDDIIISDLQRVVPFIDNLPDQIIYGNPNARAPALGIVPMDEDFNAFFEQVTGWLMNPRYFEENAPLVTQQVPKTTGEGWYYYASNPYQAAAAYALCEATHNRCGARFGLLANFFSAGQCLQLANDNISCNLYGLHVLGFTETDETVTIQVPDFSVFNTNALEFAAAGGDFVQPTPGADIDLDDIRRRIGRTLGRAAQARILAGVMRVPVLGAVLSVLTPSQLGDGQLIPRAVYDMIGQARIIIEAACMVIKSDADADRCIEVGEAVSDVLDEAVSTVGTFVPPYRERDEDLYQSFPLLFSVVQERKADTRIAWCTYMKLNSNTGRMYMGRTSGRIRNGDIISTCDRAIAKRDRTHMQLTFRQSIGWQSAKRDMPVVNSPALRGIFYYSSIRGREQQLIDSKGGLGSSLANRIRGVSALNPLGCVYWLDSNLAFGPLASYTGLVPEQCQ